MSAVLVLQKKLIPHDKSGENEKGRVRYFKNSINPPETASAVVVVWRGEAEWCLGREGEGGGAYLRDQGAITWLLEGEVRALGD